MDKINLLQKLDELRNDDENPDVDNVTIGTFKRGKEFIELLPDNTYFPPEISTSMIDSICLYWNIEDKRVLFIDIMPDYTIEYSFNIIGDRGKGLVPFNSTEISKEIIDILDKLHHNIDLSKIVSANKLKF